MESARQEVVEKYRSENSCRWEKKQHLERIGGNPTVFLPRSLPRLRTWALVSRVANSTPGQIRLALTSLEALVYR
ncbi:hypothetical protein B7486_08630 [cyanobacterium TDX16]|nr:hypothetical protein B7486_08630 [cyanobacterium TDX16]